MCVSNRFDSDKDFKGKVGDVDTSTFVIVEVHLGLDTSAFAFALNYWRFSNVLMRVNNKVDSDMDFKGKIGDEDEVAGKIQNDATSAFAFAVNYSRFSNILMCVSNKFDSDRDFKSNVGDEDEVVGKIQNDELPTVHKCCIFLLKIEYLPP